MLAQDFSRHIVKCVDSIKMRDEVRLGRRRRVVCSVCGPQTHFKCNTIALSRRRRLKLRLHLIALMPHGAPCHQPPVSQSVTSTVRQFVITSVECVPRSLRAEKRIGSTRAGVKLKFPLLRESLGAKAIAAIIAELQQIFATQGPIASHRIASQPIVHCVGNLTVHLCGRLCGMPQASRLRACVTQWEAVDVAVAVAAAAVDVACWCCACGCCCCCCCCYC